MSESDYSKVEAWQCDYCGSLHDHPSLAERCSMKCEWESLVEQIAVERGNNKKLEKAEMLEALRGKLAEMEALE